MSRVIARPEALVSAKEIAARLHSVPGISVAIDQCTREQWAQTICQFEDATYDQSTSFLADKWGSEKLSHIVVSQNGEPLAAAALVVLTAPLINKGIAYLKMGPMWRRKGRQPDLNTLATIAEAIKQEYSIRRGLMVMVLLPPDADFGRSAEKVLHNHGFQISGKMVDPNRFLVNVSLDEQAQMSSLQQKWRYNLRKSLKNEFTISASTTGESLDRFMSLYETMIKRKGFNESTPVNALKDLANELPDGMTPEIVLVEHDGKPTAGAVIGSIGDTASYLFGATDDRALQLKAGYAMQWWIINRLSERKDVHWYDLGGEAMEPGLRQFKKGLTGKEGVIYAMPGEFETWDDPLSWIVAESVTGLRSLVRNVRSFNAQTVQSWLGR